MEIDVSQLEVGDEFFFCVQGNITRAMVIRPVQAKKIQPSYSPNNKTYYKSVKCKISAIQKTHTNTWNGKTRTWVTTEYRASENYTIEKFVNLNCKNIWLLKRKSI